MIEQEMAAIVFFVLDSTDNPSPYYWKVPENFVVPSVFFPPPEIITGADTLNTYSMDYAWYIKLFAASDQAAYVLGRNAAEAIRRARNLLPLVDEDGEEVDGDYVRVDDPQVKLLDSGACQLSVTWTSRRPYADVEEERETMSSFEINGWSNPDTYETVTVETAFAAAVASVMKNYPNPDYAGEYPD